MAEQDRRKHRRASVRLPIAAIGDEQQPEHALEVWTSNISAGGMYFHVPAGQAVAAKQALAFQLKVPPGSGYSVSGGTIKGSGQVVRTDPLDEKMLGVALSFNEPLALSF